MSFQTLLITGSDAAGVHAIRERIPSDGYLVHTVLGGAHRLTRLLDGIDFDVVLIDLSGRDAETMRELANSLRGACVLVQRERRDGVAQGPGGDSEILSYPFDHMDFLLAVERARWRRRLRFYMKGMASRWLH